MQRTAAVMWARADVRVRWKSLVALGLLIGVTAGFAMAAVAGARRTDTAFERLRGRTNAADAVVFGTQTEAFIVDPKVWTELAERPEVENVAPWVLAIGAVDGDDEGVIMGAYDDHWLGQVDTPIIVSGRMFDPHAADEAVIEEDAAKHDGVHVGDTIDYHAYTLKQITGTGGKPAGPNIKVKVVGIVRTIHPYLFASLVMMSPGVIEKYGRADDPNQIAFGTNAMVQLRHDSADMAEFQRDVNKIVADGTPILNLHEVQRRVDTTLDVESGALRLLALAIALAGGLLVGQALSRSAATIQTDASVLRAVGMERRAMASATLLSHLVAVVTGAAAAIVVALVASRWFPVGFASGIDPDRGFHADWLVLGLGLVVTVVVVTGVVGFVAFRAVRVRSPYRAPRTTGAVAALQRHSPVSVGVGTAMVMERGRARVNIPIRQAMIGAIVGIIGVTATLTINASLRSAVDHPERAGVVWDAVVTASDDKPDADMARAAAIVQRSPDVDASAVTERVPVQINKIGVPAYAFESPARPRHGASIGFTVLEGRAPVKDDEVTIGPATARDVSAGIGDTVSLGNAQTARVVGLALFPQDVHSTFDEGIWMTSAKLDAIKPRESGPGQAYVVLRLARGVDKDAAFATLSKALGDDYTGEEVDVPPELVNLRNVRTLPLVLAIFLGLLALAALLHVLMTVARTRKGDFAVLRALGMTRRATRGVMNVQGTAIAIVGLVVGLPLGILLGREVWRRISESVPIADVSVYEWVALTVFVVAALIAANLVALWPGWRAGRLRPAEVLRSE